MLEFHILHSPTECHCFDLDSDPIWKLLFQFEPTNHLALSQSGNSIIELSCTLNLICKGKQII